MESYPFLKDLGFSQYEAACYMALAGAHPLNGSQLSKISGISRSRIYDVLRNLTVKGYVIEVRSGQFAPLPSDELIRRLKTRFEGNIKAFEKSVRKAARKEAFEYVWSIHGFEAVMEKAGEMIREAESEIYVRLFPDAGENLDPFLQDAAGRGVKIRYIAMGEMEIKFDVQVIHPDHHHLEKNIGGRSIEVITDKKEALVGIFETGKKDESLINWTRNKWFIVANRDSLRHDFYHCFIEKMLDRHQALSRDEERIYRIIKEEQ